MITAAGQGTVCRIQVRRSAAKMPWEITAGVLEFDPITLKIIWQVTPKELGHAIPTDASKFYSPYVSAAQRLPNGNTLITEGSDGRLIEVTVDHEIVWEWISPYYTHSEEGKPSNNMIYRAYRYPYDYVPQEPKPEEIAIEPIDNTILPCTRSRQGLAQKQSSMSKDTARIMRMSLYVWQPMMRRMSSTKKKSWCQPGFLCTDYGRDIVQNKCWIRKNQCWYYSAQKDVSTCKALHPVLEEAFTRRIQREFLIRYVDVDIEQKIAERHKNRRHTSCRHLQAEERAATLSGERDYDDICGIFWMML